MECNCHTPEEATRDYWDTHLEYNPLRVLGGDTSAGAFLSWMIEAAGDILRESAITYPSCDYIHEKVNRIEHNLSGRDWSDELAKSELEALAETRSRLSDLPTPTPRAVQLKLLLEAISERNRDEVKSHLEGLKPLLTCF